MANPTAQSQRERRKALKQAGYHQILLTLDPVALEAARRISQITGGTRTGIIRAALLTHCALLEIKLPRHLIADDGCDCGDPECPFSDG